MVKFNLRRTPPPWQKRFISWPLSGVGAWLGMRLTGLLSIDTASNLGGAIARIIGPRLSVTDRARQNIRACFPDWDEHKIEMTICDMWENFGRTAGEYAHLKSWTLVEVILAAR